MNKVFNEIPIAEPYRIKVVEPIHRLPREKREVALKNAGYNPFILKSEEVYIDIQTDSGTAAMSDKQWAAMMTGDESYSGSRSFYKLDKTAKDIFGYKWIIPAHQGRGAENILIGSITEKDKYVVSNQFFGTGATHIFENGGRVAELVIDEAFDNDSEYPFKGNIDIDKVEKFIAENGADSIGYFILTVTNNPGGGQPVSMANVKALREITNRIGKALYLDFARFAENMFFIKEREPGYQDKAVADILKEFTSYSDGCMISCKKDGLVNIGGLCCINDEQLYLKLAERVINFEGFVQYGGQAGRDMAALAQGLTEVIEDDYLQSRMDKLRYLGKMLDDYGVAYLHPVGGHALYLNANKIFPRIPKEQYPALALANELYLESGVRVCEMGSLCKGFNPVTGEQIYAPIDLCRLAFGRRVYTKSHMEYIAQACKRVKENADNARGLKFDNECRTQSMRYFMSSFNWVD